MTNNCSSHDIPDVHRYYLLENDSIVYTSDGDIFTSHDGPAGPRHNFFSFTTMPGAFTGSLKGLEPIAWKTRLVGS